MKLFTIFIVSSLTVSHHVFFINSEVECITNSSNYLTHRFNLLRSWWIRTKVFGITIICSKQTNANTSTISPISTSKYISEINTIWHINLTIMVNLNMIIIKEHAISTSSPMQIYLWMTTKILSSLPERIIVSTTNFIEVIKTYLLNFTPT